MSQFQRRDIPGGARRHDSDRRDGAPAGPLEDLNDGPRRDAEAGPTPEAARRPPQTEPPEPPGPRSGGDRGPEPHRKHSERSGLTGRMAAARGTSMGESVSLAISLGLGTLAAAVPGLLLLWLVFALLSMGVAAELLEQTGGLEPTTFGGGYWLGLAVDIGVILLCLVRRALRRPEPWRYLVGLVLAYGVLAWLLVPLDWAGIWDVPDVLISFALLGAHTLITYVLPAVLVVLLLRGIAYAWRAGLASTRHCRRISALAACLGLAGLSVSSALVAAGIEGYFDDLMPDRDDVHSLRTSGVEEDRQTLMELSALIGPAHEVPDDASGQCAEELADAREDGQPVVAHMAEALVEGGMKIREAQGAALSLMISVCSEHAGAAGPGAVERYEEAGSRPPMEDLRRRARGVRAAMAGLAPDERLLFEQRHLHGKAYDLLAQELRTYESDARRKVSQARTRLQRVLR